MGSVDRADGGDGWTRRRGSWTAVELNLEPFGSALIVFDPEASPAVARAKQHGKLKRM